MFSAAKNFVLKQETGIDVDDDLRHILDLRFDQTDLFFALCVCDGVIDDDQLVEI